MTGQGKQMPGMAARDSTIGSGVAPEGEATGDASVTRGPEGRSPASAPPPSDPAAFDAWLHAELSRLYDSALVESVPDDMIRLLHAAVRRG
jgi:hypothetical protein